jgi:hypothetical protein
MGEMYYCKTTDKFFNKSDSRKIFIAWYDMIWYDMIWYDIIELFANTFDLRNWKKWVQRSIKLNFIIYVNCPFILLKFIYCKALPLLNKL